MSSRPAVLSRTPATSLPRASKGPPTALTPLECAEPKMPRCNPFRIRTYKKCGGRVPKAADPISLGNQQILREGPLLIDPLRFAAEAGALGHFGNFLGFVFVRAFRPN